MNVIHIDKNTLLRSLYLFQYTFYGNDAMDSELIIAVENFAEQYSMHIPLAPNLLLLYTLDKEKKFLAALRDLAPSLSIEDFSVICIDTGFLVSSWLKKL